ncbi:MAG TPA: ABC transporter substrate-binding protein [Patescibacteria group bacterium]
MIVFKRRLIFWLLRAYLKRWGKYIVISFILGLLGFFILKSSFPYIIAAFTGLSKETVGVVGAYSLEDLPPSIISEVSRGLTEVDASGNVKPDLASSWEIRNGGKEYLFHLRKGIQFSDGTPFTSKEITYAFSDVSVERPSDNTIIYKLKDSYSPFLVTVSRPIFVHGYVGIGDYRIKQVKLNGDFLESLTLASSTKTPALRIYQFYPTQDALKVAFALGEITRAQNLSDLLFKDNSIKNFPHVIIDKQTNYSQLVTLFYNTQDKDLSDKRLRDGLSYALPDKFPDGERAYSSIPPTSWAFNSDIQRLKDTTHAKLLLDASVGSNVKSFGPLIISTMPKYEKTAEIIQKSWKEIGINSKIQVVNSLPNVFQLYLGDFNVPKDPDQYTLWHSYQENNISGYKSLRIDKLLEDGRKTVNKDDRLKIYLDFQKYLQDDQPATFLYFPYSYSVVRS